MSNEYIQIGDSKKKSQNSGYGDVAVRDYTASSGFGGITGWDGTGVTVGGTHITPTRVVNGTAYTTKDDADNAINDFKKRTGIRDYSDMRDDAYSRYGATADKMLNNIANRKAFSYNPAEDTAFNQYADVYRREADDALRRVLNDNNTSLYGASGAVLSDAFAARNNSLSKINAAIPDFYKMAYDRYKGDNEMALDNYYAARGAENDYLKSLYENNNDLWSRVADSVKSERDERERWSYNNQKAIENERNSINDSYQNQLRDIDIAKGGYDLDYYPAMLESQLRGQEIDQSKTAMQNAYERGFFLPQDEEVMPWLASYRNGDGTYSINPWTNAAQREYNEQLARSRASYRAKLGG